MGLFDREGLGERADRALGRAVCRSPFLSKFCSAAAHIDDITLCFSQMSDRESAEFKLTEYWKFVAKFQAVSKKNIKQRIEDLISLLDLNDELDKPIKNLSSGNQTKVIFGAAILHNPEILILDEPFTNLDIDTSEKLLSVLKSVAKKKTIFITSHNLDMVADLCDRFLIMDKGQIAIELRKSDFETAELLKMHVKELLINKDRNTNISWLNS